MTATAVSGMRKNSRTIGVIRGSVIRGSVLAGSVLLGDMLLAGDPPRSTPLTSQAIQAAATADPKTGDQPASDKPVDGRAVDDRATVATPEPATIEAWVAQLDHAQLTRREEARRSLLSAGKAAIPALAKAALSGKRELIEKSIDILGKLAQSTDDATREAASVTLQMLSESQQPSTAQRARQVLNSRPADGIQPFQGGGEFNQLGGGIGRSVSMTNSNGRRGLVVKENGIETTIQELTNGKVHLTITGGKEPVELLVKDLAELKKKSPEAHALFERYAGNGGGFNQAAIATVGNANEMLIQQLTELKGRFADNPMMQQMLDQQIKQIK